MTRKFVFDVDGTLTPSRKKIDEDFAEFFLDFCNKNLVYLVTGSDKPKTVEQIGEDIFNSVQMSFNCAGNEVWDKSTLVYSSDWKPNKEVTDYLELLLSESQFPERAGNHIEYRKGMVNFSIVGRKCTNEQRENYKIWDTQSQERVYLSEKIRSKFPHIDVYIGGETGLDIFEKGKGKSQAIKMIRSSSLDVLYYFGDQVFPGGNDFEAAMLCNYQPRVESWQDTYYSLLIMDELENENRNYGVNV